MWPFGKRKPPAAQTAAPQAEAEARSSEKPMGRLLAFLVMDILEALPDEQDARLESMNLYQAFGLPPCNWRQAVISALHLQETFPIAVLDLWYKNSDIALAKGQSYPAQEFALNFVDKYNAEDSKVDYWPPGSLEQARAFVASRQGSRSVV